MKASTIKQHLTRLGTRGKLLLVAGVIVAGTSTVAALNNFDGSGAEVVSPVQTQVNQHEERITKNEADIDATKQRVDQVEQKTDANTQAITGTTERVEVVEREVQVIQGQPAPRAIDPAPLSAPEPEPIKVINRRLIVAVHFKENYRRDGSLMGWSCDYTLESGKVASLVQNETMPCLAVGQEITYEMAVITGTL